ncbi:hypothetical protein C8J57DRAFT_191808 [Mycena rebaudengoi]|nr:hypothetical protein C8J57DRAFT_191808 [Mycena rebaudengoi]
MRSFASAYGCSTITTSKCACSSFCVYSAAWVRRSLPCYNVPLLASPASQCDDAHDVRGVVALRRRGIRLLRLPRAQHGAAPPRHQHRRHPHGLQNVAMSSTDQNAARLPEEQENEGRGHPRHPPRVRGVILSHLDPLPVHDSREPRRGNDELQDRREHDPAALRDLPRPPRLARPHGLRVYHHQHQHQRRLGPNPLRQQHHWDGHGDDGNAPHGRADPPC